jgi:hypothetical protein
MFSTLQMVAIHYCSCYFLVILLIIFIGFVRPDPVQFYGAVTYKLLPGFVLGLKKAFKKPNHVADNYLNWLLKLFLDFMHCCFVQKTITQRDALPKWFFIERSKANGVNWVKSNK